MHLLLHGIGTSNGDSLIEVKDSLIADPGRRWSVVLSNPPFGRKSSLTMVGADGREVREERDIERQDFVATTSNKQLNFVQHIMTMLEVNGRAAVVLPTTCSSRAGPGRSSVAGCWSGSTCTRCCGCPCGLHRPAGSRQC